MALRTDGILLRHSRKEKFIRTRQFCVNPRYYLEHRDKTQQLSKEDLLELSAWNLSRMWDNLPINLQEDKDLLLRLPCYEHYNRPEAIIHIDSPPPAKYRCWGCKYNKNSS